VQMQDKRDWALIVDSVDPLFLTKLGLCHRGLSQFESSTGMEEFQSKFHRNVRTLNKTPTMKPQTIEDIVAQIPSVRPQIAEGVVRHQPAPMYQMVIETVEEKWSPDSMRDQVHSVLVLGKSQSGKTALIQHIKSYAAKDYIINQSLLGDGTFSKTGTTHSFPVKSGLPSYEVLQKRTGQVINLKDLGIEYKDDEDYQDLLISSETDVGLRFAPEGHDKPLLDAVEFKFVDTPGLCNHKDKDSSHALDIIDKIVAMRSFSLVLIVVNPHNPLSAELLLAFQYYAEILGDLRNKIAFGSVSGEIEPFPSFAIDLSQKKQPVVQCMIRNALKGILQLAISRPVTMVDTSTENIQCVKRIPHPSNFDNKKRMAALDHIYGEPGPLSKVNTQEKKTSHRSTQKMLIFSSSAMCYPEKPPW
ncbi:hypothetical protein BG005_011949, partial [Podila minutissima]